MLVTGLKNEEFVVGVTGSSPADTKALLKADVGFSMNELGSEVAKHSSDIVLKDDSLKSVISAIMWGRNLYISMKRYIQFYITFVIVLTITVLLSIIIEGHIPFNLFQLLWLYLITEVLGMFSLIWDRPTRQTLLDNYITHEKRILTSSMWRSIIMNSIYQSIVLWLIHHWGDIFVTSENIFVLQDWDERNWVIFTILFQIFFYFQICNILLARNIKSYEFNFMTGAWTFTLLIITLMIIIQIVLVNYGGILVKFVRLDIYLHLITIAIGFTPLVWGTFVKCWIPSEFFKIKMNENPLDRSETIKWIQHYFRKAVHAPSKTPVKHKWRSNSQNQYDTKGKKIISWEGDEEAGIKNPNNEKGVSIVDKLKDNFRRQESDYIEKQ